MRRFLTLFLTIIIQKHFAQSSQKGGNSWVLCFLKIQSFFNYSGVTTRFRPFSSFSRTTNVTKQRCLCQETPLITLELRLIWNPFLTIVRWRLEKKRNLPCLNDSTEFTTWKYSQHWINLCPIYPQASRFERKGWIFASMTSTHDSVGGQLSLTDSWMVPLSFYFNKRRSMTYLNFQDLLRILAIFHSLKMGF